MTARVRFTPLAARDLEECGGYIALTSPDAAEKFLVAVRTTLESLRDAPGIGRLRPMRSPRLAGLRSWRVSGFPNHLVFYQYSSDAGELTVVRLLHGARDIPVLLDET